MTHEELLAKIDLSFKDIPVDYGQADAHKALRAIVEMHRPALDSEMDEYSDNETLGCAGCGYDFNYSTWETNYPCPTIKAIEKELM